MEKQAHNTPPTLVVRRVINARRDRVFAAWTKPEIMSQWFFPGAGKAFVTNDCRVGGTFENKMVVTPSEGGSGGCGTLSETNTYLHTGEYLEVVPPEKIVFTWSSHAVTNTRVTVVLREVGDTTELTLTHELLETEQLRQAHSGGWEGCLANLANLLG